jgi:hypothetical protein
MSAPVKLSGSPLWAITSYFNPQHYERRLLNYRLFRERMTAPLITVELALNGEFELRPDDADVMVQLPGRDVLWHKERLLNIALNAVPPDCRKIAWLDCDVVFQEPDWARLTSDMLDRVALVQPFRNVCELGREVPLDEPDHPDNDRRGLSLFYGLAVGAATADMLDQNMRLQGWNAGLAWAASREVLPEHGFYDACIMGSGSRVMVCAALGRFDYARNYLQMSPRWMEHYMAWARPHFESVRGSIGFLEGTLLHLWHGDLTDRRYMDRHRDFRQFDFDPAVDIAKDDHGCWRWNSDKPRMHQYVRDYFAARKEDG